VARDLRLEPFSVGRNAGTDGTHSVFSYPWWQEPENDPAAPGLPENVKKSQYLVHYHEERNHQGKDNRILFPSRPEAKRTKEECGVENDWEVC
jgi:hypothetical protein